MHIYKKEIAYSYSKPKKEENKGRKKVHIGSTSIVLQSFLLDSPTLFCLICLFIYLFIYLVIYLFFSWFSLKHIWIFTKAATVRNYIYTWLQILLKGR